jgi:NAD(P)-dependent dehydrogenase (short-subunit alcohol dehydrogenase family)
MIQDFKGKTAVLTGAGSGFGLECARIGAARGMNLVLVDVQQDALDKAAAEMEAAGVQVLARKVDVSDAAQMEALAAAVKSASARRTSCSTTLAWARAAWCGRTRLPTGNGCWASTSGA